MPPAQDCSTTGLSLNGCSFMRETQSMAFFKPPGIDQLYSGETMTMASALRISSAQALTSAGNARLLSVEIVDREFFKRGRGAHRHPGRRAARELPGQRGVVGALAQRAANHKRIEFLFSHNLPLTKSRHHVRPAPH